jgi:hypothetical protein
MPLTDRIRLEDEGNACPTREFKAMKIKMKTQTCPTMPMAIGKIEK